LLQLVALKAEVLHLVRGGSMHIEAYRSIRTSILFSNPERPPRSILVTSAQPGEGKTSTTVNLAISLAQMRHRVLVVDADLRQSRCHKALGMPAAPGLIQVLRGHADLDSVIQRLSLENGQVMLASESPVDGPAVDLLQSGEFAADASELLTSMRARATLQELTERYEIVLIDSPPVFPITDAALLATVVDGVVLVVHGRKTERQVTREALERLRFMNASMIGVVLNGVDPRSSDYYRYSTYFGSERVA
jgi:polysaccharide biosynthesis transport protein